MARSPKNMIVASCLTVIYVCATILSIIVCLTLGIRWSITDDDDGDYDRSSEEAEDNVVLASATIYSAVKLVLNLTLLIASIVLMIGINKESHRLVAPTIFITPVDVLINLVFVIFILTIDFSTKYLLQLFVIVLQIALWIPMLLLYVQLRKPRSTQQSEAMPLNTGYNNYLTNVPVTGVVYPPPPPGPQAPQPGVYYPQAPQPGVYYPQAPQPGVYHPTAQPAAYPTMPIPNNNPTTNVNNSQQTMEAPDNHPPPSYDEKN